MTRYRCRREHCDNLASMNGGLCDYHMSPPDLDLAAQYERPWPTRAFVQTEDDMARMSSQEKYLHPECE